MKPRDMFEKVKVKSQYNDYVYTKYKCPICGLLCNTYAVTTHLLNTARKGGDFEHLKLYLLRGKGNPIEKATLKAKLDVWIAQQKKSLKIFERAKKEFEEIVK